MAYAFLALVCFSGEAFALGGRPILTSRIISVVPRGYSASLLNGLMPALCTRLSTVLCGKPSSFAISVKVSPSIHFIIGNHIRFLKMFEYSDTLLNRCKAKIENIFKNSMFLIQTHIDYMFELCDTINKG